MQRHVTRIVLSLVCLLGAAPGVAQYVLLDILNPEFQGLPEQTADDGPRFGAALAAAGDRLLVGAPKLLRQMDGSEAIIEVGGYALYQRHMDRWSLQAWRIGTTLGSNEGDRQGWALGLVDAGDRWFELAGAPFFDGGMSNRGRVSSQCRGQCAFASVLYGQANDNFGYALAVATDAAGWSRMVVGARGGEYARVFLRQPGAVAWEEEATLTASNGSPGDLFGHSVAISVKAGYPDWIAVGAPQHANLTGAAYVFRRDHIANTWSQVAVVNPPSPQFGDLFGVAVAYYDSGLNNFGHILAVGAPNRYPGGDPNVGYRRGTVSLFRQGANPGSFTHDGDASFNAFVCIINVVLCEGREQAMDFGAALAFDGEDLWIGAPGYGTNNVGRVYRARPGPISGNEGWWLREMLSPGPLTSEDCSEFDDSGNSVGRQNGRFGTALAVFDRGLAVGYPGRGCVLEFPPNTVYPRTGQVRIYGIPNGIFADRFEQ